MQEPYNNTWIKQFVQQYGVKFPMFNKTIVNEGDGPPVDPVFQFLRAAFPGKLEWNFVRTTPHTRTNIMPVTGRMNSHVWSTAVCACR